MKKSLLIHPEELTRKWIDRMADLHIDTLALHPRGGKDAAQTLTEMLTWLETPSYRSLIDDACKKGLNIEYEFHAAGYLLPRNLFASHPDWFRMNKEGKRVPDLNFCCHSEQAMQVVEENAVALAKKLYRSQPVYYFWLDDSKDAACHCPLCREYSASDCQLYVVNRIQRALRREIHKNAKVAFLAYYETLTPPTKVQKDDGVFLEYAPIQRDIHKKLADSTDGMGLGALPQLLEFFGTKDAKVLDYWYDNSLFSRWKKPPVRFTEEPDIVKADMEYYRSLGFEYLSSFACFLGADYEALYGEPSLTALGS